MLLLLVFLTGATSFFPYAAFPMQIGVIAICGYLFYQYRGRKARWDRSVPTPLFIMIAVMLLTGIASIVYGFANVFPTQSPTGKAVSQFGANVEGGVCYATYNRGQPIPMPLEFCDEFMRYFSVAFCGFWLVGSALANWAAWKRRET